MPIRPFNSTVSPIGTLMPDFSAETLVGQRLHRRDFKGRRHLVLCFAATDDLAPLFTALATAIPSWQIERAATLVIVPAKPDTIDLDFAQFVIADHAGDLRGRFGVGAGAALFIADRYGEIVFHALSAATPALPLEEVLPILEQIEMRCSL